MERAMSMSLDHPLVASQEAQESRARTERVGRPSLVSRVQFALRRWIDEPHDLTLETLGR